MRHGFKVAVLLLSIGSACGPPQKDVDAARLLIRAIESNKSVIRTSHSQCLAAVTNAKTAQDSERLSRDFPSCVEWRGAQTKHAELTDRLEQLCKRTREACRRAEALDRDTR